MHYPVLSIEISLLKPLEDYTYDWNFWAVKTWLKNTSNTLQSLKQYELGVNTLTSFKFLKYEELWIYINSKNYFMETWPDNDI